MGRRRRGRRQGPRPKRAGGPRATRAGAHFRTPPAVGCAYRVQVPPIEGGRTLGVYRDITGLKLIGRPRSSVLAPPPRRANQAKSTFLATMSHGRTPMNGVMGTAELLEREPLAERQKRGWCAPSATRRRRSCASSMTCWISPRSKPAAWSSRRRRSAPRPGREHIETLSVQADRKGLRIVTEVDDGTPDHVAAMPPPARSCST